MKTQRFKMVVGLFILASAAFGSACGFGKATAQKTQSTTTNIKPPATATPYKPLKRVSKDVIKPEPKDETVKVEAKQKN
jgi:hypothetical protein